jgi:hypothetical protein
MHDHFTAYGGKTVHFAALMHPTDGIEKTKVTERGAYGMRHALLRGRD